MDSIPSMVAHDGAEEPVGLGHVNRIPHEADFLLGLAAVTGYRSYRSKSQGTWYIQTLCEVFGKYHNKLDVMTMLTMVNDQVCKKKTRARSTLSTVEAHYNQVPMPVSTLRKRVWLRSK